jgi:hypothetical protein
MCGPRLECPARRRGTALGVNQVAGLRETAARRNAVKIDWWGI